MYRTFISKNIPSRPEAPAPAGPVILRWLWTASFYVAWAVGRVIDRVMVPAKRVLVIRTDDLGDAVLFEPALRSLADRYADHELHVWAPEPTCDLYRATPYVTRLVTTPRGDKAGIAEYLGSIRWSIQLGYALGRWSFTIAVYPVESPEPIGNWLVTSARACERWITFGDLEKQFYDQRRDTTAQATRLLTVRPDGGHELLRNAHLARQWEAEIENDWPNVHGRDHSTQIAFGRIRFWRSEAQRLEASGIIGVVPAGDLAVHQYPAQAWNEILHSLWNDHGLLPAFLGGPAERPVVEQITKQLEDMPYLSVGSPIDVLALASLIAHLDVVVSVDTAPAHLALAQKIPTVVLCGGGHPGRFFPWPNASASIVLNQPMPCAGCLNRCSLTEPECLTRIRPQDVIKACVAVTDRRKRLRVAV